MEPWTVPTPQPLDGPLIGDDRPMLEAYLAWQRSTLHNICAGLTGAAASGDRRGRRALMPDARQSSDS